MGGQLTVMARLTGGRKKSFKIGTGSLKHKFDRFDILDENAFLKLAKKFETDNVHLNLDAHDNYDVSVALFAPYHYGLLFIDFENKKLFSCNGYSGFMLHTRDFILSEVQLWGSKQELMEGKVLDSLARGGMEHCEKLKKLLKAFQSGAQIVLNDVVVPTDNMTFDQIFIQHLVPKFIGDEALSLGEKLDFLMQDFHDGDRKHIAYSWNDIETIPIGWTLFQGSNMVEDLEYVMNYAKQHQLLSDMDVVAWEAHLAERFRISCEE